MDCRCLPKSISDGGILVVECSVVRYWNRNWANLASIIPGDNFFMDALKVCTSLSASPFDAGW